ncbi:C2 calcium-dependent membrane targeting [Macleaya cordata]|uniref:C2 calcium-dependent membrane targeting n=1 Tax=Macleaya cordata TaxID=56857 RepID=A0A200R4M8_MACCD|nr:C2 calcium-dependent membrane targeting [Macleaya cordata]
MRVEVCIISARGLRRPSSLWKLQWYAVGWIDPNNKYCTKIDASGSKTPTWKTKFSAFIDDDDDDDDDSSKSPSLQIQVYSRDPIFLREKLHGTATILLKEFFIKFHTTMNDSSTGLVEEEVGSFQLRKKSSGKPQGFVDVSIRLSEEEEEEEEEGEGVFLITTQIFSGNNEEGFELGSTGQSNEIFIGEEGWSNVEDYHHHPHPRPRPRPHHHQPSGHSHSQQRPAAPPHWKQPHSTHPVAHSMMSNNPNLQPSSVQQGTPSSYRPPPPPPPPPSHVGFLPTFLPRTDHYSGTYMNNARAGGGTAPAGHSGGAGNNNGLGMGMSVGALAAGAVLFGDDFMSGFDIPGSLQEAPLPISTTHPPF